MDLSTENSHLEAKTHAHCGATPTLQGTKEGHSQPIFLPARPSPSLRASILDILTVYRALGPSDSHPAGEVMATRAGTDGYYHFRLSCAALPLT